MSANCQTNINSYSILQEKIAAGAKDAVICQTRLSKDMITYRSWSSRLQVMMEFPQLINLDDVTSMEGVLNAAVITRNGEYVEGSMPANTRRDTFAAMSAILLGASERLAIEVNDSLDHISVNLSGCMLTVIGLDSQYLMTAVSTLDADPHEITSAANRWKERAIRH